jgi:hypothetical protein
VAQVATGCSVKGKTIARSLGDGLFLSVCTSVAKVAGRDQENMRKNLCKALM